MEFILEYKAFIFEIVFILFGAGAWYFGHSQKKTEENEGVGFVDPELSKFYDKMRISGRFITFVGIGIVLYQLAKHFFLI